MVTVIIIIHCKEHCIIILKICVYPAEQIIFTQSEFAAWLIMSIAMHSFNTFTRQSHIMSF